VVVQFLDLKQDMDKLLFLGNRQLYILFVQLIFLISFNSYSQISLKTFYGSFYNIATLFDFLLINY